MKNAGSYCIAFTNCVISGRETDVDKSPLSGTKKDVSSDTVHKTSPSDVETVDRGVGPTPLPPSIADCRPYCGISLYTDPRNGLIDHPMGKYRQLSSDLQSSFAKRSMQTYRCNPN